MPLLRSFQNLSMINLYYLILICIQDTYAHSAYQPLEQACVTIGYIVYKILLAQKINGR